MSSPNNSIFLAYSQDAVHRLPYAIAKILTAMGIDVYIDTNHFGRYESPPQHILTEISRRTYYVILLTPASIRWGFNLSENRLRGEAAQAEESGCQFVVLCGYGSVPGRAGVWWSHFGIPDTAVIKHIDHHNLTYSLESVAHSLDLTTHHIDLKSDEHIKQLDAEAAFDEGLTEEYDAQNDNRRSTAIRNFDEALEIDPEYAAAYFHRAEFYKLKSNHPTSDKNELHANALRDYNTAIRLEPTQARYYNGRAWFHENIKDREKVLADFTLAIRHAPQAATYYSSRGSIYRRLDQFDKAIADYTSAIRLQPQEPRYYHSRSSIHSNQKDYRLALQDLSQAIAKSSRYIPPRWYVQRGFLYRDLDMPDAAESDWQQAVEVAYHADEPYSYRARIHMSRGELAEAQSAANLALEINPDNRAAQSILRRLDQD